MQHLHVTYIASDPLAHLSVRWLDLPIPYMITPRGKRYLAKLRVEQEAAESGANEQVATGIPGLALSANNGPG